MKFTAIFSWFSVEEVGRNKQLLSITCVGALDTSSYAIQCSQKLFEVHVVLKMIKLSLEG